jgi:uncharacterized protein YqfA (UPF0365 family)
MSPSLLSFLLILGLLLFAGILNYLFSFLQWYMAVQSGIKITLLQLFRMRRKGMPVNALLDNLIKAKQFNIPVTIDQLYAHHQRGGDVYNLIDGLVRARKYGLNVSLEKARNADLQNIKLTEAVEKIAKHRGLKN